MACCISNYKERGLEHYASKIFALMHISVLLGWVKRSDIEIVQISILIGFGYDLSDAQDGLRCWRNGICILW